MIKPIETTAFKIAERFVGTAEVGGAMSNPLILAMLRLDQAWPTGDETPWCSAFCNFIAWELRLPRSKNLSARSWLGVGTPIDLSQAEVGFDVVILKRGENQPGPEVIDAQGHVGFYAGVSGDFIMILGGNQGNAVNVKSFPKNMLLGIRRLT